MRGIFAFAFACSLLSLGCDDTTTGTVDLSGNRPDTAIPAPPDLLSTDTAIPPTCDDKAKNGAETDVDCGGTCPKCAEGQACGAATDCKSGSCEGGKCVASCTNSVKDGAESDVDCGGTCPPCAMGKTCLAGSDCVSGACAGGQCQTPSCTDGAKNGTESDVDCGGTCPACAEGKACATKDDCAGGVCTGGKCAAPSCTDGAKNGDETDLDCGGTCTTRCADGKACKAATDCTSGACKSNVCASAACTDGVKNGTESDVDCGGSCPPCVTGGACAVKTDCASQICTAGKCVAPSCTDMAKNGDETDVDCGGACPTKCGESKVCAKDVDCASGNCSIGKCAAPSCTDGIKNGAESDVDCGGSCPACLDGKGCGAGTDCASKVCTGGKCAAPSCTDKVKNGKETDVDCGGGCPGCGAGQACTTTDDCAKSLCDMGKCQTGATCLALFKAGASKDGVYTIDPDGAGGADAFDAYCDMTTDGGGWTLIGKGREDWKWNDAGLSDAKELLNLTTNKVAYLPSFTVRAIMASKNWNDWSGGLRVVRASGINDKWFFKPTVTMGFAWAVFDDPRHGCGSAASNGTLATWRQVGGSGLSGQAQLLDNIYGLTGNDCNRVFTPGWSSHNCIQGWSSGASCNTGNNCWTAGGENHCIPMATVWVRD